MSHPFPPVSPDDKLFTSCLSVAASLPEKTTLGWLLYLASHNHNALNQALEEIRTMATNDAQLTQAVTDLLSAYEDNTNALADEVAALRAKGLDGADPAISAAVNNIENLVAQMKQSTAAARAALAPASATNPPQASASGNAGAAAGGSSSAAAGTTDGTTTSPPAAGSTPAGSGSSPASATS